MKKIISVIILCRVNHKDKCYVQKIFPTFLFILVSQHQPSYSCLLSLKYKTLGRLMTIYLNFCIILPLQITDSHSIINIALKLKLFEHFRAQDLNSWYKLFLSIFTCLTCILTDKSSKKFGVIS